MLVVVEGQGMEEHTKVGQDDVQDIGPPTDDDGSSEADELPDALQPPLPPCTLRQSLKHAVGEALIVDLEGGVAKVGIYVVVLLMHRVIICSA